MPREMSDSVVVITGASSGIGRATALAFAGEGASLVLAARREQPLLEAAAECESLGGRALAVSTDVTDEDAVKELARRAARAMPPVYPAEKVAKTIVGCAKRPKREVFVGNSARMINLQHTLAPGLTERSYARMVDRQHSTMSRPRRIPARHSSRWRERG